MMTRCRALRLSALGLAAAAAASSPLWGPAAFRRVPLFDAGARLT